MLRVVVPAHVGLLVTADQFISAQAWAATSLVKVSLAPPNELASKNTGFVDVGIAWLLGVPPDVEDHE